MEKSTSEPAKAHAPIPSVRPALNIERVLGVRLSGVAVDAQNYWLLLIRERVAGHYRQHFPLDPGKDRDKARQTHLDRLLELRDFAAIVDIWTNSNFVTDAERGVAGALPAKVFTRHSLSRRMQVLAKEAGEDADVCVFEGRASRLVDAMLCFGLLEEREERANLKPLTATALLDQVMRAYQKNYMTLLNDALDGAHHKTSDAIRDGANG
jgi:hypothetical protein